MAHVSLTTGTSVFDKWLRQQQGFTNFGSFQTAVLQAYKIADLENRRRLQIAFPVWFSPEDKANDPIYIENLLYVSKHAQAFVRYVKGLVRAHIQDERVIVPAKDWEEWIKTNGDKNTEEDTTYEQYCNKCFENGYTPMGEYDWKVLKVVDTDISNATE